MSRLIASAGASADAGRLQQPAATRAGSRAGGTAGRRRQRLRQSVQARSRILTATAGDRVFFAFDRSDISPEAQQILQRQADWLRRYPNVTVTIEGHCDERGTREYNLALGERRAKAAKNVLVALGNPGVANFDDQLRQGAPDRRRLERGGLGAKPRRHHDCELKRKIKAKGLAGVLFADERSIYGDEQPLLKRRASDLGESFLFGSIAAVRSAATEPRVRRSSDVCGRAQDRRVADEAVRRIRP